MTDEVNSEAVESVLKWGLFVFDFDGVLVDSYTCLPIVYRQLAGTLGLEDDADKFVARALYHEGLEDARGNYHRWSWWPRLLTEFGQAHADLTELVIQFHMTRVRYTEPIEGAYELLRFLKKHEKKMVVVCGSDGETGIKEQRIDFSGFRDHFDGVYVTGESVIDREDAINTLAVEFDIDLDEMIFIDDKCDPLTEVSKITGKVATAKVDFKGPLKFVWAHDCESTIRVQNLAELHRLFLKDT
ncbi:MAG: HAD family hydrolase [Candidatus Thorarchaeota archaeon]|jgi:putative hydrolase of the HAD superfamily